MFYKNTCMSTTKEKMAQKNSYQSMVIIISSVPGADWVFVLAIGSREGVFDVSLSALSAWTAQSVLKSANNMREAHVA